MVPGIAMKQVQAGKARALAITSLQPSDVLPGIPTMASQGYPGFESISWDAIFVPAGTPDAIVNTLNQAVHKAIARDDVKQKMAALYFTPAASTPGDLHDLIVNEKKRWDAVINRLGLSLD
jgi:tripartite-type tricarboxylate transporter receptor subunit TctC